jgi:hypothetical protein
MTPVAEQDRDKPDDIEQDDAHVQRQHGRGEGDAKMSVHGGDPPCAGCPGEDEQDGGARQYAATWIRMVVVQPAGGQWAGVGLAGSRLREGVSSVVRVRCSQPVAQSAEQGSHANQPRTTPASTGDAVADVLQSAPSWFRPRSRPVFADFSQFCSEIVDS